MANFPWGAFVAFLVIVFLSFTIFQIADLGLTQAGTEELEQSNETLVVDYNNDVRVAFSPDFDRYTQSILDNETITNSSGNQLVEGTDYEFTTENGSVNFINTSATTSGENVNITYTYEYNIEEVRQSEPILQILAESVPLWVMVPFILFIGGIFVWAWTKISSVFSSNNQLGGGR